jgi:FkbM family methyltransferase
MFMVQLSGVCRSAPHSVSQKRLGCDEMKHLTLILITVLRNLKAMLRKSSHYSQHYEDLAIEKYLPEKDGYYLDIGCGNPVIQSNTFLLYKRGWRGHMVDAWPLNCLVGKIIRHRDQFSNVVVSLDGEESTFYVFDPYQYSTADKEIYSDLVSRGVKFLKSLRVEGVRLAELIPKMGPLDPSFLSVDVEGLDFEVLASNDWITFLPRVVCVENISGAADDVLEMDLNERNQKSLTLLTTQGYELVEVCGPSQIFVHSSYLSRSNA